jgi:hypothetical protein
VPALLLAALLGILAGHWWMLPPAATRALAVARRRVAA